MSVTFQAGPYKSLAVDGQSEPVPWYVIPFDKSGTCTAPLTREHLLQAIKDKTYTDVFLFSHGWNNDWDTASQRYQSFIDGVVKLRHEQKLSATAPYKPLLVGLFWPSIALVMPWEKAPKFAATSTAASDTEQWRLELEELVEAVEVSDRDTLYALTQAEQLQESDAGRLADLLARVTGKLDQAEQDTGGKAETPSGADLLERARHIPRSSDSGGASGQFGFVKGAGAGPKAAAIELSTFDPRNLVRIATVLRMKDRAARVGATGVHPLLRDLLAAGSGARVHLIGHSYGAIVLLSSVCYPPEEELPAKVDSLLLLQPAVSQWCFAHDVAGKGYPGGYESALWRVRGSILTTFSKHDTPLTRLFHLAVRRSRDLGQPRIAPEGGLLPAPPSLYAALGGFGPAGLNDAQMRVQKIQAPPQSYSLGPDVPKVLALNGDEAIQDHGDVSQAVTWWALLQQLRQPAMTGKT